VNRTYRSGLLGREKCLGICAPVEVVGRLCHVSFLWVRQSDTTEVSLCHALKKIPKETKHHKLPQFKPYNKGSPCTLYTKPRLLNPRGPDGQLDTSTQIISYKWVDACLKYQRGDKIKEGLWLKMAEVKDQKRNPTKSYATFYLSLKTVRAATSFTTLKKIDDASEEATAVECPDSDASRISDGQQPSGDPVQLSHLFNYLYSEMVKLFF